MRHHFVKSNQIKLQISKYQCKDTNNSSNKHFHKHLVCIYCQLILKLKERKDLLGYGEPMSRLNWSRRSTEESSHTCKINFSKVASVICGKWKLGADEHNCWLPKIILLHVIPTYEFGSWIQENIRATLSLAYGFGDWWGKEH